ncbi:MAG: spermidine synthase [Deltaproteobacteria bacterium]|uniref:Spermidine synthase n=1 Tax=Candidatus Zymogenus saltonus TaxID=2844893 RepID=A0A9D8PRR5_9DELT|nr:spermidine synthase [Candidatus Zymogenus saltonus]
MSVKKIARVVESEDGVGGTVMLKHKGTEGKRCFELLVGGHYVMAATDGPSERILASEAVKIAPKREGLTALVGGLGLGLTLNEILKEKAISEVWVSEIEEAVIRWNRTHLRHFNGGALFDRRVRVHHGDVMELMEKRRRFFDLILMDVDNGPSFLILEGNGYLYTVSGMKKIRRALKRGGVFALWSHRPDEEIEVVLDELFGGFKVRLFEDPNIREELPPTAIYTAVRD